MYDMSWADSYLISEPGMLNVWIPSEPPSGPVKNRPSDPVSPRRPSAPINPDNPRQPVDPRQDPRQPRQPPSTPVTPVNPVDPVAPRHNPSTPSHPVATRRNLSQPVIRQDPPQERAHTALREVRVGRAPDTLQIHHQTITKEVLQEDRTTPDGRMDPDSWY